MYTVALLLHLLAACIWVGGHLILAITILPHALKTKSVETLLNFENKFEKLGIPALIVQIISGFYLADWHHVKMRTWFQFDNPVETVISIKLICLVATLLLGAHARLKLIPNLSPKSLNALAIRITLVTLIGVTMLILGTLVRFVGL